MEDKERGMTNEGSTEPPAGVQNFEDYFVHSFNCTDVNCLLPLCVNTKLLFKHMQSCTKPNCSFCRKINYQIANHVKSCVNNFCSVPLCMEAKLKAFLVQIQEGHAGPEDCPSTGSLNSGDPSWKPQSSETKTVLSINASQVSELEPIQETSSQESSRFKKRDFGDNKPRELKQTSYSSASKVIQPTKRSRVSLGRRRSPTMVTSRSTPIRSQGANLVLPSKQEATRKNAVKNSPCPRKLQSRPSYVGVALTERFNGSKRFQVSGSHPFSRAITPSNEDYLQTIREARVCSGLDCRMRSGNNVNLRSNEGESLKVRFFQALFHLMSHVMKTNRRGQFLTCIRLLRGALHEINNMV